MITIQHEGSLITTGVFGEFTVTDYQEFEREVLATLRLTGRVDLLVDLRDMLRYTLDVAWEDLRFVRAHAHDFRRVAVIARDELTVWLGWITRLLTDADVRVFDTEAGAREWLAEGAAPPAGVAPARSPRGPLMSVAALASRIGDPGVVIFDCRHDLMVKTVGTEAYARGHLPGARFAHVDEDLAGALTGRNGRHPLPDRTAFAAWLGRMGVSRQTEVVAYDASGGTYAARLWWMLRHWLGHEKVAVLDGGWDAWVKTGHPVSTDVPVPQPVHYDAGPAGDVTVDAAHLLAHLGSAQLVIIDARAADRFRGQNETIDPVAGHIPGAVNRFFRDNLDAMGFFKPAAELHAAFTPLIGTHAPSQVVHSCGSGVSACHNLLAMEIAGLSGTRLYPGSWSEWCSDPARPVET
jgi:thiosulfate/3-mercaptopyruvate sulfurtransferase